MVICDKCKQDRHERDMTEPFPSGHYCRWCAVKVGREAEKRANCLQLQVNEYNRLYGALSSSNWMTRA